jgi:MoaA/NifB/PqqE/SkfB family radical SAM enzyme
MTEKSGKLKRESFTSANAMPVKLFGCSEATALRPIHVQWTPTNRCNLNCSFCSCAERDRDLEMDWPTAVRVIRDLADLGCKAATITGGGEPLLHPHIGDMIATFRDAHIKVGLVTNGLLLHNMLGSGWRGVTWCRISNSDNRNFAAGYASQLATVCEHSREYAAVDWAFSHVVTSTPNLEEIVRIVEFAEAHDFTHVRLVADLFHPDAIDWEPIRKRLNGMDRLVIYQPRTESIGATSCLIGYIKPVIAPDFKMYLCCGVQYANDPPAKDFPESLCMGSALDLKTIYAYPRPFEVACKRCYYDDYNRVLSATRNIEHGEFI